MQNDHAERLRELLADLKVTRACLSGKQQELLRAVAVGGARPDSLCQEVRALSERVMAIIDRLEDETVFAPTGAHADRRPRAPLT